MMGLEERLRAVEGLYEKKGKGYRCAIDIVMKDGPLTKNEKTLICQKIDCSLKTIEGALTKLRKAGLYSSIRDDYPKDTKEPETPKIEDEDEETEEKYVTVDQFNQLVEEIRVISGIKPIQEPEEDYVEEQFETPTPERVELQQASMKQMGTWIEAKNLIYFDFARNGAFGGALEDFDGNWSDFVNTVLDDYFRSACTRDGPCQYRMNVGLGLLSKRFA